MVKITREVFGKSQSGKPIDLKDEIKFLNSVAPKGTDERKKFFSDLYTKLCVEGQYWKNEAMKESGIKGVGVIEVELEGDKTLIVRLGPESNPNGGEHAFINYTRACAVTAAICWDENIRSRDDVSALASAAGWVGKPATGEKNKGLLIVPGMQYIWNIMSDKVNFEWFLAAAQALDMSQILKETNKKEVKQEDFEKIDSNTYSTVGAFTRHYPDQDIDKKMPDITGDSNWKITGQKGSERVQKAKKAAAKKNSAFLLKLRTGS
jgi:hypothetical protein